MFNKLSRDSVISLATAKSLVVATFNDEFLHFLIAGNVVLVLYSKSCKTAGSTHLYKKHCMQLGRKNYLTLSSKKVGWKLKLGVRLLCHWEKVFIELNVADRS